MQVWSPRNGPAAIGDDSATSASKGNAVLHYLLVEAAPVTVRSQPQWRSKFFRLAMRRGRKIAKVAMTRNSVRQA